MNKIKNHYVYYSYEQFGRGYIGYRKYPEGLTPESDKYLGSFRDKSFKPTEKIILFQDLTKEEAIEIEIKLHAFYNIDKNDHFANKAKQTSLGFSYSESRKGEKSTCYGKIRINNGIKEIYISPGEEIPEGYFLGIKEETKRKQSEAKKGENHPNYGRIVINNGIKERFFSPDEEIPEGYIVGRLPYSKEYKQKCSEAMKGENNPNYGKVWYNNGIENKYFSPDEDIPEGYIVGRLPYSKESKQKKSIKVITSTCCYFSVKDAIDELGIFKNKFYKLFVKDSSTGFYVEKKELIV